MQKLDGQAKGGEVWQVVKILAKYKKGEKEANIGWTGEKVMVGQVAKKLMEN